MNRFCCCRLNTNWHTVLEQVKSFRYLGSIITDTCDCKTEITARLGMARSAARLLTSLWKDRSLNLQLKSRLMQSLVWSVATYGCESWTINAADCKRLNAFEMDVYRRMLRISWTEHRTNNSILEELEPARRFLASLPEKDAEEDHGDARLTPSSNGLEYPSQSVFSKQRTEPRALVSVSVTSDPQS